MQWSALAIGLPDAVADLPGDASSASSVRLTPGQWYFHMRTQGKDGRWTSTVNVGPYVIQAAAPGPTVAPPLLPLMLPPAMPPPAPQRPMPPVEVP